jgi:ubiquinone/menaquinone biosynthesis C-methylase UbiE
MNWALALFGHDAEYIVGAALLMSAVIVGAAFAQGRQVSIGPASIGERPRPLVPPAARAGASSGEVGRVFEVSEAKSFYKAIAPNYDERNSANLIATHLETIIRINEAREVKPALRVLDLGGGTGQNIATHFFSDASICWTYVDFCPAMVEQLEQHLRRHALSRNLQVLIEDINRVHLILPPESYDIILMSLVLTSMPKLPDFGNIAGLLAPGGRLIISDIDPDYTRLRPFYKATAGDGCPVAMRMRPVAPRLIAESAQAAGLRQLDLCRALPDDSYSFITTFTCGPRGRRQLWPPRPARRGKGVAPLGRGAAQRGY